MATFDPSSREREAHAEIAATRVTPPIAWALLGAALALGALAAGLEAVALARGGSSLAAPLPEASPTATWAPAVLNQRLLAAAREIERRVDQHSALARAIRPWGQLALVSFAGYGNEEAYVGRGDWLVYRPDFDHLTGPGFLDRERGSDPVEVVSGFAAELEPRGIALLLVPVPAKPSIHPESLTGADLEAPPRNPSDSGFAERLRERGVYLLDATVTLRRAARAAPAYLERDTHWRPEAMDEVARETAIWLRAIAALPVGDPAAWSDLPLDVQGRGDTATLLDLPPSRPRFAAEAVVVRPVSSAAGQPFRPARGAPVLLLGDSFSAIYSQPELGFGAGAGFGERLSFHLGLPVDRLVRNAGGASATRAALAEELRRDPARLDGVVAVVWQLAARELSQGTWDEAPLPPEDPPADPLATTPSRPTADSR